MKSCLHSSLGDDIIDELARANWHTGLESRTGTGELMILFLMSVRCIRLFRGGAIISERASSVMFVFN